MQVYETDFSSKRCIIGPLKSTMRSNIKIVNINSSIKSLIAAAVASMVLLCSAALTIRPYKLVEEYAGANFSKRPILLSMPDEENIFVENPDDVADDYGGLNASAQSRIVKYYFPLFRESFRSLISGDSVVYAGVNHPDFFDSLERRSITVKIENDTSTLVFSVPTKDAMLASGFDSVVAIIIDRISFKRNNFYFEYYWDDMTKRQASLEATAKVLIWDYKNDAAVFYGKVSQKIEFQFALQRRHWDESARELAKKIIFYAGCL